MTNGATLFLIFPQLLFINIQVVENASICFTYWWRIVSITKVVTEFRVLGFQEFDKVFLSSVQLLTGRDIRTKGMDGPVGEIRVLTHRTVEVRILRNSISSMGHFLLKIFL